MRARAARSLREMSKEISRDEFAARAFFPVREVDSYFMADYDEAGKPNFIKSPDKKVLLNAADDTYISTVGKNYKVVENQPYFESVIQTLEAGGIEWVPQSVHNDGKSTSMIVKLPNFSLFKGTNEEQDMQLRIRNSFDTTIAASTIIGFLRLICTNGMTSFTQDFNYRLLHKGDVLMKHEQALELYKDFDNVWRSNEQIINQLGNMNGNRQAVADWIGDGEISNNGIFLGPRWAKKLLEKWQEEGEPNNLWALYNIFTNIASHGYGNTYNSKVNIMEKLNDSVKTWPKRFKVVGANPFKEAA